MENKETFQYTYSAKEQAEIRHIRAKYQTPTEQEDKMARLRRLDAGVSQKAQTASLSVGIIGALLLGGGMSLVMTELGTAIGLLPLWAAVLGIAVGIAGLALVGLAYPLYNRILKREREKLAPEILRLTEELLK